MTNASFLALFLAVAGSGWGAAWLHEETTHVEVPGGALVVATYNVHQYYAAGQTGRLNLDAVADVVRESRAVIIGLQETEGARVSSSNTDGVRWLAHALGYHAHTGPPTSAQTYGVALLSKYPIRDATWTFLPSTESIERVALVANLSTPDGDLLVLVTHFQTDSYVRDRTAQARAVVNLTQGTERAVLLGDFNTEPNPNDPAYQVLDVAFTDAWVAAGNDATGGDTDLDDPGTKRIDYVFLKGSWTAERAWTLGGPAASDHRLVAAQLSRGPD